MGRWEWEEWVESWEGGDGATSSSSGMERNPGPEVSCIESSEREGGAGGRLKGKKEGEEEEEKKVGKGVAGRWRKEGSKEGGRSSQRRRRKDHERVRSCFLIGDSTKKSCQNILASLL